MGNKKIFHTIIFILLWQAFLRGQEKRDFNWIIGYDSSAFDTIGEAIHVDFNQLLPQFSVIHPVDNFHMEGSNTSMSTIDGRLLFYSNGCIIVNSKDKVMKNGDSINPGLIQNYYCITGGSPWRQGVIALPRPGHVNQYLVFILDMNYVYADNPQYLGVAPTNLYYNIVDMQQDSNYGAVILKNQIAVSDTLARCNISAVRHKNDIDWWVIVPRSHSNCYYKIPLTENGVGIPQIQCLGHIWTDQDTGGQSVFSPDAKKYLRFNSWNGLNIFDFDNENGTLSNPVQIFFPNDTINYTAGISISSNSRFAYVSARKKLYQFDLQANDIESSKILIANWDGFQNPGATLFYMSALAPDEKIYISNSGSTKNLHVIERPNCQGLSCQVIQHGINLPGYNYSSIPNIPHYRFSTNDCDSISNADEIIINDLNVALYPNPVRDLLWINCPNIGNESLMFVIHNVWGAKVFESCISHPLSSFDLRNLQTGTYYYSIQKEDVNTTGVLIKME